MTDPLPRLLVDGRTVCHPTAGERGIGRYTIGLLGGLHQIGAPVVALYETEAEAQRLTTQVPGLAIAPLSPATVRSNTVTGSWFVATQLMLHPVPLDPVPRIVTEAGLPVAAVMYDVIPERYPAQYQVRPTARAQVRVRGMLARTLDVLLAISDFAADTAAAELHFPRERITTIGAGCDRHFSPATGRRSARNGKHVVINVAGGNDPRKNVERLIMAWRRLPASLRATHQLYIVNGAAPAELADITYTGSLSDAELVALHHDAVLAIVPSIEEGFGLPALEAAACACVVLTSNVSALPEVLAEPAAQFDPFDVDSMTAAIARALTDPAHRDVLLAAAQRATQRWTWPNTAQAVVDSLARLGPRRTRSLHPVRHRVALIGRFDDTPLGRANQRFAASVAEREPQPEVTLLVDHGGTAEPTNAGPQRFPARALGRFVHRSQFDDIVTLPVNA